MKSPINSPEPSEEEKASATLSGTVEKIIKPRHPDQPELAQVTVDQAEELYREIRIENTLKDESGQPVGLKPGATVEVIIEADPKDTVKKRA
jgi:hypothetical protein